MKNLRNRQFQGHKILIPTQRNCGTMANHFRLLEMDPQFRKNLIDLEHETSRRMRLSAENARGRQPPYIIPVVVHVVYNTASENISTGQIKSQITVLNKDFRAKNKDKNNVPSAWKGLIKDAGIQFTLATKDPHGKATPGITRTKTSNTSFSADDSVKSTSEGGMDPWPTNKYLHIWVCSLKPYLGYAQFPGGSSDTDGVVILNTAFGTKGTAAAPFNLGRTTTHEIGHWLNLRHIWGDTEDCSGSDFISDTPNAESANFGKPTFPHISCTNGPNGDMFVNFMDYVDDDSMYMFTPQQVIRMIAALEGPRKKFLNR